MDSLSEDLLCLMNDFFDERSFEEKLNILDKLKFRDDLSNHLVDNLAASLDLVIGEGTVEERFKELRNCVQTRAKYELRRLR